MNKRFDIVAIVGKYTKDGQEKSLFKNVGSVMDNNGKSFILLDKTFNPAALAYDPNKDSIILNLVIPKNNQSKESVKQDSSKEPEKQDYFDDDIPF